MSESIEPTITLTEDGDWWIAKDMSTGVTTEGRTREGALENLDEAFEGYHSEGKDFSDEQLQEAGIDPKKNRSGHPDPDIFE